MPPCDTFLKVFALVLLAAITTRAQEAEKQYSGLHCALQVDGVKAQAMFETGNKDADRANDCGRQRGRFYQGTSRKASRNSRVLIHMLPLEAY
jgi:hypothetical protein